MPVLRHSKRQFGRFLMFCDIGLFSIQACFLFFIGVHSFDLWTRHIRNEKNGV